MVVETALDRQYKRRHKITWIECKGSNGLDNWLTVLSVIYSYPSPPNG